MDDPQARRRKEALCAQRPGGCISARMDAALRSRLTFAVAMSLDEMQKTASGRKRIMRRMLATKASCTSAC